MGGQSSLFERILIEEQVYHVKLLKIGLDVLRSTLRRIIDVVISSRGLRSRSLPTGLRLCFQCAYQSFELVMTKLQT